MAQVLEMSTMCSTEPLCLAAVRCKSGLGREEEFGEPAVFPAGCDLLFLSFAMKSISQFTLVPQFFFGEAYEDLFQ
jgi:hypothetical protein